MKSMMGIKSPTGSHLPVLEEAARAAGDRLVVEHGAGLYSTPLLARLGCRVVCVEAHPGWAEWARWIYQSADAVQPALTAAMLSEAALVFIDGPAKERGPLLMACLAAGVPTIIAHDTQRGEWRYYDFKPHMFEHDRYVVSHSAEDSHRTTRWVLK